MMTLTAADGHVLEAWRAEPDAAPKGGVVVPPSATLALERTLALFDRHIAR
jgi:hypothetical protein